MNNILNDTIIIVFLSSSIIILFAVAYVLVLIVTNRRIIEEQQNKIIEINKSEERYKALFENSLAGMMKFDIGTMEIFDANASVHHIFQTDSLRSLQEALKKFPEAYLQDIRTSLITRQRIAERELRLTLPNGRDQWLLFSAQNSHADHLTHAVIIDITEKKQLERAYVRAQKMETISLMTNSVAHDLQNIFAPIQMSVQSLQEYVTTSKGRMILATARSSANDGMSLVKTILSVGSSAPMVRRQVNLGSIVKECIGKFNRKKRRTINIHTPKRIPKFTILGNEQRLIQVFNNLLENAKDAMPHGGILTVAFAPAAGTPFPNSEKNNFHDRFIMVSIADTGVGIPEKDFDRIFEPFYSTKRGKGGTGLGLSIVHGIVKEHGGYITIESTINQGTSINVFFPLYKEGTK